MMMSVVYERVIGLMRSSRDWLWKERVQVAVESGSAMVEACLLEYPGWAAGEGSAPDIRFLMDESEISVRTERFRPPDIVWIFSTAKFKRLKRDTVRPVQISDPTIFALVARRGIRLGSGAIVTGSVVGSTVRLESGSEVVGSVISRGELFADGRPAEAVFFDSAMAPPKSPVLDLKMISKSWPRQLPEKSLVGGALTGSAVDTGYFRHAGDLRFSELDEQSVFLWVEGNLTIDGKSKLRAPKSADTPVLVVEKNITGQMKGGRIEGVIYVEGTVTLRGECLITGTIIADEIDIAEGVVVESFDVVPNAPRPAAAFWKRQVKRVRN